MNIKIKNAKLNYNLITSIFINVVIFLCMIILGDVKFETSDDFVMQSIVSGAYSGNPNPHMMFINVLYGKVLAVLYNIFPNTSWYVYSLLFVGLMSFIVIGYVILEYIDKPISYIVLAVLIMFFSDDIYILIQFTKTASLAVISGSMLFLAGVIKEKVNKKQVIIGGFIVLLGVMLRYSTIYLAGPFILYDLLCEIVVNRDKYNIKRLSKI